MPTKFNQGQDANEFGALYPRYELQRRNLGVEKGLKNLNLNAVGNESEVEGGINDNESDSNQ